MTTQKFILDASRYGGCDLCGKQVGKARLRPWNADGAQGTGHLLCPRCYAKWSKGLDEVREMSPARQEAARARKYFPSDKKSDN